MSKLSVVSLMVGLLCLLSIVHSSQASSMQSSFVIKGRPLQDLADVLIQMRRFLSNRFTAEQRCQRQAIALSSFKKGSSNHFEVADIALARKEDIQKRYDQINVELLRNLYIDAAGQFLGRKIVDASLIEVLNCLKAGFRNRDAKARSFLNNEELNTIVKQFETISKQPVKLLLEGNAQQFGLNLSEFHDSVKATIRNWVADNKEKVSHLFGKHQHEKHGEGHDQSGRREPSAIATVEVAAETPEQLKMEHEEQEYLDTLFGSLIAVYESLPLNAKLGDRCQTYNRLIEASREDLYHDDFINHAVEEVSNRLAQQGPLEGFFKPGKKTRADFLFVVETFDPLRAGAEVWLDLNDCLSKWVDEDEEVIEYMNSPQRLAIIDQLTSQLGEEDAQPHAQSVAVAQS